MMLKIGEVAKRAGVSVQTLRHYDKIGLLPPAAITPAGYRLYDDAACQRLELVRTLRDVGFDLAAIGLLLRDRQGVGEGVDLQLAAIEAQIKALKRQQILLQTVKAGSSASILERLKKLNVLTQLNQLEREQFLSQQLGKPEHPEFGSEAVWQAAVSNLPEQMNEQQLEAWLELAELVADSSFHAVLQTQMAPFVSISPAKRTVWQQQSQQLMSQAVRLVEQNEPPESKKGQLVAASWTQAMAAALGETPNLQYNYWVVN